MALHSSIPTMSRDGLTLELTGETPAELANFGISTTHLPAEWSPQSGVQLTWPHAHTDWAPILPQVTRCYVRMAMEIACRERLLIVAPHPVEVRALLKEQLPSSVLGNIALCQCPTNDTWARDHGFITLRGGECPLLLDFRFNGWGEKFESSLDNAINSRLYTTGLLNGTYTDHNDFVLEGGSIESDGQGTILTTAQCLTAPHRNQPLSEADIEERLLRYLHADRVLWIRHGYLAGDDTDCHVDTLARLCPADTIAYVQCNDKDDEHYTELQLMEEELKAFRTKDDKPYRLMPLPMAAPVYDEEGNRLPATYANFLVMNGAVLMPTYGQAALDEAARAQLQKAFPRHQIVGIDCRPLIVQHGSLHCCTMQFPVGVINEEAFSGHTVINEHTDTDK